MYVPQGNIVPRFLFDALVKEVEELKKAVEELKEQKTDEPPWAILAVPLYKTCSTKLSS